jgi:hypothetical protein
VPAISPGTARLIGCCRGEFLVNGDSVLLLPAITPGDSVAWLRVVTTADGVPHDSIRVRRPGRELLVTPSPNGRWLAAIAIQPGTAGGVRILRRNGEQVDSIDAAGTVGSAVAWVDSGRGVLYARRQSSYGDAWDLCFQAIDGATGHRDGSADSILHHALAARGTFTVARTTGALALAEGPVMTSVIAAQRPDVSSLKWKLHLLKRSTGWLSGIPSPDGQQVLLQSPVTGPGAARLQLSLIPFDSGAETSVGAPVSGIVDWDWPAAAPAHPLYLLPGAGPDDKLVDLDPVSGMLRTLLTLPDTSRTQRFEPLPGGGLVTTDAGSRRIVVLSDNGSIDREIPHPLDPDVLATALSADGAELAMVGYTSQFDSVAVYHVHLADGDVEQLAAFPFEGALPALRWLADGTILTILNESGTAAVLYAIRGTVVRRLGALPWGTDASYAFAPDGLRIVVTNPERHADVWLVRNLRKLLPH